MAENEGSATDQAAQQQTQQTQQQQGQPQEQRPEVPPEVAAALRKANKEAETLRLRLKEIEDKDKTEAERLAQRTAEAERRAAEAESKALRAEVAASKGVPSKFLTGTTQEELEASADEFLAEIDKRAGGRRADIGQGARQTAETQMNGNDWMRQKARK